MFENIKDSFMSDQTIKTTRSVTRGDLETVRGNVANEIFNGFGLGNIDVLKQFGADTKILEFLNEKGNDILGKVIPPDIFTTIAGNGFKNFTVTDDPMVRTHAISFFTTPTSNVIDYINQEYTLKAEKENLLGTRIGNLNDTNLIGKAIGSDVNATVNNINMATKTINDKVNKVTESLSDIGKQVLGTINESMSSFKHLLPDRTNSNPFNSNFMNLLNQQNRNVTMQKLTFNIESTIGNLQQERNMQPTFSTGISGGTFQGTFQELDNIEVTKTIMLWYLYIKGVNEGSIRPPIEFILNNIVDYKISVYTFHVKPNMKEIMFFSKYTGVFPSGVPTDVFESNNDSINELRLDVEFSFDHFECLNPKIIDEFNYLTKNNNQKIVLKDKKFMFT